MAHTLRQTDGLGPALRFLRVGGQAAFIPITNGRAEARIRRIHATGLRTQRRFKTDIAFEGKVIGIRVTRIA